MIQEWLKKRRNNKIQYLKDVLGISRLESLEHFTLANVVDRLSDSYIIMTADDQRLNNSSITVPFDKNGILLLGQHSSINNCYIENQPYKIVKQPIKVKKNKDY
jgi:hypothetical protein